MVGDERKAWPAVVLVLLILAIPVGSEVRLAYIRSVWETRGREALSGGLKQIEFWENESFEGKGVNRVIVDDPNKLTDVIGSIRLNAKEPCGCKHEQGANFYKSDGSLIKMTFCDHCFSLGGREGEFEMPVGFYRRAMTLLKQ